MKLGSSLNLPQTGTKSKNKKALHVDLYNSYLQCVCIVGTSKDQIVTLNILLCQSKDLQEFQNNKDKYKTTFFYAIAKKCQTLITTQQS